MRRLTFFLSLILMFMIPMEGIIYLPGLGTATKAVGLFTAGLWMLTVLFTGKIRKPGLFHIIAALFVFWNVLSIFWSIDANRTFDHVTTWIQLIGMSYILWDLFTSETNLRAGLQAFIFGSYIIIGSAFLNYLANNEHYFGRFSAVGTNTNDMGAILALGIPIAMYLSTTPNSTKVESSLRLINLAFLPAAIIGIALTGSRTALLASIPGLFFGITSISRIRISSRILMTIFLVFAVVQIWPTVETMPSFDRFTTIVPEIESGRLNQRTYLWQEGLDSFVEHPILGVGSNTFRSINTLHKVAHNSFISVMVELGLIGLLLFASLIGIAVNHALAHPKWHRRFWLACLTTWAINASALTWEHRKPTWFILSMVVVSAGILVKESKVSIQAKEFSSASKPKETVLTG